MPRTSTARKTAPVSRAKPAAAAARFTLAQVSAGAVATVTTDHQTGLQWSHTIEGRSVEHAGAQALVDHLNATHHGGHGDWRLPTVEELFLIADRTKRNPAIDTDAFPDTKSDWYWTASSCAGYPDDAWIVDFSSGSAYWLYRHYGAFVRAVRGPSARASQ